MVPCLWHLVIQANAATLLGTASCIGAHQMTAQAPVRVKKHGNALDIESAAVAAAQELEKERRDDDIKSEQTWWLNSWITQATIC